MSVDGKWDQLAGEISDDVVRLFAAIGRHDEIVSSLEERFGGVVDALRVSMPQAGESGLDADVIQDIRRIPTKFEAFAGQQAA
jgi:hypothetical protein